MIPLRDIQSLEQLKQYQEEDDKQALVVGYFDEKSEADKALFDEVYNQLGRTFRFASVTSREVLKSTKYTSAVVVHKPVLMCALVFYFFICVDLRHILIPLFTNSLVGGLCQ